MRVIQYSRDSCGRSRSRGVLDRPPSRATTAGVSRDSERILTHPALFLLRLLDQFLADHDFRRGTRKNIADAQAIESAKIAAVSGSVVVEWPPR